MDRERNEDLNPHGDDIEEKVRRMLDPSVPDEDEAPIKPIEVTSPKPVPPKATPKTAPDVNEMPPSAPTVPKKTVKPVSSPAVDPQSAPEAVETVAPKAVKKITITEHDESPAKVAEKLDAAIAELAETPEPATPDKPVEAIPVKPVSKPTPKKATKTVADKKPVPTEPKKAEPTDTPTAPLLSGVAALAESEDEPKLVEPVAALGPSEETDIPAEDTKPELNDELKAAGSEITVGEALDQAEAVGDLEDLPVVADPETDKAVDDIIASESDEILEIEDAVRDTSEPVKPTKLTNPKPTAKPKKAGGGFGRLFKNRAFRWILFLLLLTGVLVAGAMPHSRYLLLNTAGVRAASSVTVVDNSTQQPLKNVQVSIGSVSGVTDANGEVKLTKVKLGQNTLTIQKRAFATVTKSVVIGWGSNPLASYSLTPTGTQYEFTAIDYLSGKPLPKVQASSGEADAISNDQGVIKLTLDKPADDATLKVDFKLDNYRDESLTFSPTETANRTVKMVPAKKHLFVSKRSGKYDVYSIYVDGKDEKVLLSGTGSERDDMVLVPHPTEPIAAYVSTRGNQHNNQNFLLSTLTIVNTDDGKANNVVAAERIQLVDWSGDYLVYVQIASGESTSSPKRYQLMSYNLKTTATKELAASNYFNDVVSAGGEIYYAPSSAYQSSKTALYKVKADGTGSQTVFNQEVWNIIRTSYDHLALSVEQQWYDYQLGGKTPQKLNAAPSSQEPRVYSTSPDGKQSAWVDVRDGKGVLLTYDPSTKTDKVLTSQSGLTYPIYWLSDTVLVYRVKTSQETADYAISTTSDKPIKIRDVTNAGGIDRWYYY